MRRELSGLLSESTSGEMYDYDADDGTYLAVFGHETWRIGFRFTHDKATGMWDAVEFAARPLTAWRNAQDLRHLPLGALMARARAGIVEAEKKAMRAINPGFDQMLAPFLEPDRQPPVGVGRPDADYARLSLVYDTMVRAGERSPTQALADLYGGTAKVWGSRISKARSRGLLEPKKPGPGRAVGKVTDKAMDLIFDDDSP